jgi:hypothetical protein
MTFGFSRSFHCGFWNFPPQLICDESTKRPTSSQNMANLLCPRKGAFVVFSDGHRDCLGKGFAQAEFCAVTATLLNDCSIELVLPEGATPSDAVWNTMFQNAWKALDDGRNMTSFKMYGKVPVRFVPRGSEWRRLSLVYYHVIYAFFLGISCIDVWIDHTYIINYCCANSA